jgi:hypothetical protein
MPRTPAFNEADVSDKPAAIRRRPLLGAARINGITEMYRQRLESILAVDEGVASIVRALQDSGELERTLFIYTSDNGFFHGEHRIPNGKVQHYEPSARVPLVMRGPGVPAGVTQQRPAVNVDLAPTILDAAKAKAGRVEDGISLLGWFRDPTKYSGRDVLLETGTYAAIHTPRYVYVEHNTGERELYDLQTDPYELASVHDSPGYTQIRSDLARRLLVLRTCKGATCRRGPSLGLSSRCVSRTHRVGLVGGDAPPRRACRLDPPRPRRGRRPQAARSRRSSAGRPASSGRSRRSATAAAPRSTADSRPAVRLPRRWRRCSRSRTSRGVSAGSSRSTVCRSTFPPARSSG